jgi:hypothetical protein
LVHKKISLLFIQIPRAITLGIVLVVLGFGFPFLSGKGQQAEGYSLQFFGNGQGDIDRVKIPLQPQKPVNIGSTDFTIEWWLKANPGDNTGSVYCDQNDGWIYGNILFDRDIWGEGDYGDFGIALNAGGIAFGVNNGASGNTVCGSRDIADGKWHHLAVIRQAGSGELAIYVDGSLDAAGEGPMGDISYRENRATSYEDDPFLVIGAEKHDAGSEYPSFKGWVDEVRVSNLIRYTETFSPENTPFTPDEATMALFHFDEGPAGPCTGEILDAAGKNTAFCQFGGSAEQGPVFSIDHPFLLPVAASQTTVSTQAVQPVTVTPAVEDTSTAQPTFTPVPVQAEEGSPTVTAPVLEEKLTPTAVVDAQPAGGEAGIPSLYLFVFLAVLLAAVAVGLFWIRRRK